ncbi:MAG TPA: transglycosylase SLT domain-containing protein [Methylomirabilota bacterium]|nr:transglycosylase SLT domain-containing protein [Methylomirabilota bacterium]
MQPSLNRRLLALLVFSFVALAFSGNAGAETYPFAAQEPSLEAPLVPSEPSEGSSGGTFRAIEIELGLTYSPGKPEEPEAGLDTATLTGDQWDPLAGMPIVEPVPVPETTVRKRGPAYDVPDRPEVAVFVERFQTGYRRAVVERWLTRAGRYMDMIRDVLIGRGLPEELLCTAMIESGFDPIAVSRAGAKGLWQFMAPTARKYGLRVDKWTDERLDPEKSTRAAAAYLRDLYAAYGSWPLAHAAYNGGDVRILRAMKNLKSSDFWDLTRGRHLAEETKNFVAAIQAAILIVREPERYGFAVTPEAPLQYETIRVSGGTKLVRLAEEAGIEPAELRGLNSELRMGQTPPGESYALKVPVGGADKVRVVLERDAAKRSAVAGAGARKGTPVTAHAASDGVYVVKPQDTVGGIAKRYGVSVAEIRRWNRLTEESRIRPGDRLRVAMVTAREDGQGGFR